MSTHSLHFPIRVPDDVLVELGKFTGTFWSDSFAQEPFVIEAIRNYIKLHGSGNRNAWKAVWLRLPGSNEWLLADVCRSARKAAIARLHEGGAQADHRPEKLPEIREEPKKNATRRWRRWRRNGDQAALADSARPQ